MVLILLGNSEAEQSRSSEKMQLLLGPRNLEHDLLP